MNVLPFHADSAQRRLHDEVRARFPSQYQSLDDEVLHEIIELAADVLEEGIRKRLESEVGETKKLDDIENTLEDISSELFSLRYELRRAREKPKPMPPDLSRLSG